MGTCTSLDHVYPITTRGRSCYCGQRTWAGAPRSAATVKAGTTVLVLGETRVVVEKLRGEDAYRIDAPVKGRTLFERDELEAV